MKRIILFRFSKESAICNNRLELLKHLNPQIPIYGIFGGEEDSASTYENSLGKYLEHFWVIKDKTRSWKWRNIDLALRDWYQEMGKGIDFDMAYLIEWDLVLIKPISEIYSHIGSGDIGATGLIPLSEVESRWSWTSKEPEKSEWKALLSFVQEKYQYDQEPFASLGPGTCYPKLFLEKYASLEVPVLCHDELRVPLFAQVTNTALVDTGFYREWYSDTEKESFNCNDIEIPLEKVLEESLSGERYVFHPVRVLVPIASLDHQ